MKLHVFNPEHDLALAANLSNFTAPHAGRQLRADLGYIPALWAKADDLVLVENVDDAERRFRRLVRKPFRRFISKESLAHQNITAVDVWGWDPAICAFLRRQGISEQVLPSASNLATIRELSHRNFARQLLLKLQGSGIVGEASIANSLEQVETLLAEHKKVVVKAPWSSSGRGVRFISDTINIPDKGWIRNVISSQGSVMVEPYYNKVRDFGMEFESDGQGKVSYLGLSLFHTVGGSYMGNILADEETKSEIINRYVTSSLLIDIRQKICTVLGPLLAGKYQGLFGVDMMIVAQDDHQGFLLHPCLEMNLRRTMGHVALSLLPYIDGLPKVMNIVYDTNIYKMRIVKEKRMYSD